MTNGRSPLVALIAGFVLALVSAALAEFASGPPRGHRIDTSALPAEAKAILAERPGTTVSAEQWRRLDKVMLQYGGWPGGTQLFVASVRHSWYWFVALPILAVAMLRGRRGAVPLPVFALVAGPSLLVLGYALASTPATALL